MSDEQTTTAALTPETAFARLQAWFVLAGQVSKLKVREVLERKLLAPFYFPTPKKGVNRIALGDGYDLVLEHSYNYNVDETALDEVTAKQIKDLKLPWDDLFVYKPSVSLTTYNKLTAEQRKFVDGLLTITDATPKLTIAPSTGKSLAPGEAPPPPPTDVTPVPFNEVQDPDEAKPGDYYCDDDKQWWHVKEDGEWEQCADPNLNCTVDAPAAKPKRTRKKKDA